mgnify:CR=1 FL=1
MEQVRHADETHCSDRRKGRRGGVTSVFLYNVDVAHSSSRVGQVCIVISRYDTYE